MGQIVTDPALRNALGLRALGAAASREANVLAFNDTYMIITVLALLTVAWLFWVGIYLRLKARRQRLLAEAATR